MIDSAPAPVELHGAGPLRDHLRRSTGPLHAELESRISLSIFDSLEGYGRFLVRTATVVPRLEASLLAAGIEQHLIDWPLRMRSTALLQDLASLGVPGEAQGRELFKLSAPQALGAAYVLEGSRFGNQVLSRKVGERCPGAPRAYLSHGRDKQLWVSFLEVLEQAPFARAEVAWGSIFAFQLFLDAWSGES